MYNLTCSENDLALFDFEDNEVRTLYTDNQVWFVAKDVCDILGLTNTTKALKGLDEDQRTNQKLGRQGDTNLINESGLYTLVIRSNMPAAKQFRRWVTDEVLPSIRKHGYYIDERRFKEEVEDDLLFCANRGVLTDNDKLRIAKNMIKDLRDRLYVSERQLSGLRKSKSTKEIQ